MDEILTAEQDRKLCKAVIKNQERFYVERGLTKSMDINNKEEALEAMCAHKIPTSRTEFDEFYQKLHANGIEDVQTYLKEVIENIETAANIRQEVDLYSAANAPLKNGFLQQRWNDLQKKFNISDEERDGVRRENYNKALSNAPLDTNLSETEQTYVKLQLTLLKQVYDNNMYCSPENAPHSNKWARETIKSNILHPKNEAHDKLGLKIAHFTSLKDQVECNLATNPKLRDFTEKLNEKRKDRGEDEISLC